ncbi:hypothetical protein HNR42_000042 [Deinobacterium chartae]|uniref:Uncharacterized protein n=1 Tax=Deinobacterium chartae TaxID=521158 RepID=A0A841HWP8_9DEIO|nr:VLRF1 family aeRF1-type release factor [Deinobacterium chartae]MBB6096630.1 hypothetical protein [Deinobacterium chartae]
MITQNDIERIKALPEDKMVLMAVINVDPTDVDNQADALPLRVRKLLENAGTPPTVIQQVLDDVAEARRDFGKSAVYVIGEGIYERFGVQLRLPERAHYGRPLPSIITNAAQTLPTVGILMIDREWARLFKLEQGEIRELQREENVREEGSDWRQLTEQRHPAYRMGGAGGDFQSGAPNAAGAADTDFFDRREDAAQKRFFNHVVAELGQRMKQEGLRHLILMGPDERVAKFRLEIPETAPYTIIGQTNVGSGTYRADENAMLEKVMPIVEQAREQEEIELLSQLQERGIVVMENVLEAIQQNQIYRLAIPEDGAQVHIYRSHNREVPYFTAKKDLTESPLDGSLMERVTLEECLSAFTELYGVEIVRLHGDHARRLIKDFGGLAGLPRF